MKRKYQLLLNWIAQKPSDAANFLYCLLILSPLALGIGLAYLWEVFVR